MGDRVAILHEGNLQQFGTPIKSYYEPENRFVAGFIGSPAMNFIDVEVESTGDGISLQHPAFTYQVSERFADQLASAADDLVLGIRPEDIEITDDDAAATVEVTVDVVEPLGKEQLIYFDIGGGTYTASLDSHRPIRSGEQVCLRFPESLVYMFDRQTGTTIKSQVRERGERPDGRVAADPE